ncbi:hypothetical protein JTB14_027908 [Gonioctena quinquepunctata]|nr:hypothetical protein JTB14_027908 [Gonioctena quinquepunctata]
MDFHLRRLNLGGTSDVAQIDSFGGGPDYGMFLNAVHSVGTYHDWTKAQMMRTFEMKLKDKAREYYGSLLPIERSSTMDQMENWFRSVFGRRLTMSAGKRELERCIRNPDKTCTASEEEGGMKPWKTTLKLGLAKGTNEEEAWMSKEAPEIMERIAFPTCKPAVFVEVKEDIER